MSRDPNETRSTLNGGGKPESAPEPRQDSERGRKGSFVVVVGPDGAGKTTLAAAILRAREGRYFHFRPPFRASNMHSLPPHQEPPVTKDPGSTFAPLGWLRLARNVTSSWIGFLTAVRPTTSKGELVVADRWLFGYLVQPRPLRYGGPRWLARAALAVLPSPDLVINLSAPVEVIASRKKELSPDEIVRELEAWRRLPVANLVTVDSSSDLADMVGEVLEHIADAR